MNLEEANSRLNKANQLANEDELWALNDAYLVLDFHKDDFCKIINAVGKDKFLRVQHHFSYLRKAQEELQAKEKYIQDCQRFADIEDEKAQLKQRIDNYRASNTVIVDVKKL